MTTVTAIWTIGLTIWSLALLVNAIKHLGDSNDAS